MKRESEAETVRAIEGNSLLRRLWRRSRRLVRKDRYTVVVLFLFLVTACFAQWLAPHDPVQVDFSEKWKPVSRDHFFGTDQYGRDVFSRVLYGGQIECMVVLIVLLGAAGIGVPLGVFSGYFKGRADYWISRLTDALLGFPPLLLALAVVTIVGFSLEGVIVAMITRTIPVITRIARAATLSVSGEAYFEAARSIGCSNLRIMRATVLPNIMNPLLVQFSDLAGKTIFLEAELGFLGVGAQPPSPSWGAMLGEARTFILSHPMYLLLPSLVVIVVILAFNSLGDTLQKREGRE